MWDIIVHHTALQLRTMSGFNPGMVIGSGAAAEAVIDLQTAALHQLPSFWLHSCSGACSADAKAARARAAAAVTAAAVVEAQAADKAAVTEAAVEAAAAALGPVNEHVDPGSSQEPVPEEDLDVDIELDLDLDAEQDLPELPPASLVSLPTCCACKSLPDQASA